MTHAEKGVSLSGEYREYDLSSSVGISLTLSLESFALTQAAEAFSDTNFSRSFLAGINLGAMPEL